MMIFLLKILSLIGLALTVVPSFLVFKGLIPFEHHTLLMFIGMILWFATAPFWMKEKAL